MPGLSGSRVTAEHKYRAFLSYSHQDRKWAGRLHRELERYRIPRNLLGSGESDHEPMRNLRPIFRDLDELSSGSSLSQLIQEALSDSESLIVICSPSAVASQWVNNEIRTFQQRGLGERIFCLIVDGEPLSGDERECFPEALIHPLDSHGLPLPEPEEPIAADARGGKREWRHAKLMLIAGLLGVGLDELMQRDLHRRSRYMFAVAAGSASIAVVMAGLTMYAFISQAKAERRQAEAEDLVGFLIGDLREDLYSVGRQDLYARVAEKAMEYFHSLEDEDVRDEILAQRAEALRHIGDGLQQRSDMAGAMKAFEESLSITRRLVAQSPERLDWSLALAESHFYVGEIHWQKGDLEAASAEFRGQLAVMDALMAAEPDKPERLEHSGYAWTNYGRILEIRGEYDDALIAYQHVMDNFQRLVELQPESADAKLELGFAHNNLGKLKISLGLLAEAEAHFRVDLLIKKAASEQDPANNSWRENLASSHFWLGKGLQAHGDLAGARKESTSALGLLEALLENDPEATRLLQRKAAVQTQLAANCRMKQESACARMNIENALTDLKALTRSNSDNARWLRDQAYSDLEAAWQAMLSGNKDLAMSLAEGAGKTADHLATQAPMDLDVRKLEVMARLTLGDIAQQAGLAGQATMMWESALDTLNQHFENSRDPNVLELQTRLAARSGKTAVAKIAQEKLTKMNYLSPYPWPPRP